MLGVALVVAVLLGGGPRFTGPRWNPGEVQLPAPRVAATQPSVAPAQPPSSPASPVWPIVLLTLLGIGVAFILWLVLRAALRARGRRPSFPPMGDVEPTPPPLPADADAEAGAEPDAPVVHRGLRLALDELDQDREPADAVVRAWLGLQSAAEDSGVQRRAAETPSEFTARVITRVQADAAAAGQLVDVYQAVRFGGHPITSAEVRAARAAIERLLDSWHEPILRERR